MITVTLLTHYDQPKAGEISKGNERGIWWGMLALLLGMYALLWNHHWVPGGDSDFYLVVARNLVLGRGFTYNARPVLISPPGWPLVLAGLLKISPMFGFLKLAVMAGMIVFFLLAYQILRRFTTPWRSAVIILLCAINSNAYPLTFWPHSDALFCVISTASILLALQMSERRWGLWRLPLLLMLCSAAVFIRWAGVGNAVVVACALFQGRGHPWKQWDKKPLRLAIVAFCCILTALTTFIAVRHVLDAANTAWKRAEALNQLSSPDDRSVDPLEDAGLDQPHSLHELYRRIIQVGKWDSALFWQPLRLGTAVAAIGAFGSTIGWLALTVFVLGVFVMICRDLNWLMLGVAAHSLGLHMLWPHIEARYLVPLLPLILLAMARGIGALAARWPRGKLLWNGLTWLFIGSVVLCNVLLYAVDVVIARSPDFYAKYEGGLNQTLIDADYYLAHQPVGHRQVAVSLRYDNLHARRSNPYGQRVTVLLTGKNVVTVGSIIGCPPVGDPDSAHLLEWLAPTGAKYYLCQEPIEPWRVGHFRVPSWLEARWTHKKTGSAPESGNWELWELHKDSCSRIELPRIKDWPNRVPGL